ncbi:MAG: GNAT family N-acetyltransferase [Candidatus Dormibacteraeota bacterium]|nr:GNAT family N-acetyltransferase [Candidatus Dormibacteraeota bacterium]
MTDTFLLPAISADDSSLVEQVCLLVNRAYTVAEAGMWRTVVERTTSAEVAKAMRDREMAVAYEEDHLVGAIRSRLVDEHTGWFGALAVDCAHGGRGVGGQLVRFVEEQTGAAGATMMRLEVLVPLTPHPHTERLAAWYSRLGYREVGRCSLVEVDPPRGSVRGGPDRGISHGKTSCHVGQRLRCLLTP